MLFLLLVLTAAAVSLGNSLPHSRTRTTPIIIVHRARLPHRATSPLKELNLKLSFNSLLETTIRINQETHQDQKSPFTSPSSSSPPSPLSLLSHLQSVLQFPDVVFPISAIYLDRAQSLSTPRRQAACDRQAHFLYRQSFADLVFPQQQQLRTPYDRRRAPQQYSNAGFGAKRTRSDIVRRLGSSHPLRVPFITSRTIDKTLIAVFVVAVKHAYNKRNGVVERVVCGDALLRGMLIGTDPNKNTNQGTTHEQDVDKALATLEFLENWVLESLGDSALSCSDIEIQSFLKLFDSVRGRI